MGRQVCELCAFAMDPDEAEEVCDYSDCPLKSVRIVDVSDELHQILGEALRSQKTAVGIRERGEEG